MIQKSGMISGRSRLCATFLLTVALLAATPAARGEAVHWTNGAGNGDWFDVANWMPARVPLASDTMAVALGSAAADGRVYIAGGGSLSVSTAEVFVQELNVAASGAGSLSVGPGGKLFASAAWLGFHPGSVAVAAVEGGLFDAGAIAVGASGDATLRVTGGQAVLADPQVGLWYDGVGRILLSNAGSELATTEMLTVGNYGQGTIEVGAGTTLTSSGGAILAQDEGAFARVEVDGGQWDLSGDLVVALAGTAEIEVLNGGVVNAETLLAAGSFLGESWNPQVSAAMIEINNGQFNLSGTAYLGEVGEASVSVSAGGVFTAGDAYLGIETSSQPSEPGGIVNPPLHGVDVAASCEFSIDQAAASIENLFVGCEGRGQVVLSGDSTLDVADRLVLARNVGGYGELRISEGSTASAARVEIGGGYLSGGTEFVQEGLLALDAGALNVSDLLVLGRWGGIAPGSAGDIFIDGGRLDNACVAALAGRYAGLAGCHVFFGASGVNTLEVATVPDGRSLSASPRAFQIGTLELDDMAELDLADAVDNDPGSDAPEVVYVDSLILGGASTLRLNGLRLLYGSLEDRGGATIDDSAGGQAIALIAKPADLDGDGTVNIGDFVLFKQVYNTVGDGPADLNMDGVVDIEDFVMFKKAYGS